MAKKTQKVRPSFDQTRLSIIQAALQLVAEKGVAEASLADIAKAVKMSKGTLYYYYPSKEHLLHAIGEYLVERMNARFIDFLDALPSSITTEVLAREFIEIFAPASESVEARVRIILLAEAARGNAFLQTLFQSQYRQCRTLLEMAALKALGCNADQVRLLIAWLIPALDGVCIQRMLGFAGFSQEDAAQLFTVMTKLDRAF